MGVVHKACDTELGRTVAIKAIHEELLRKPEIRKRFIDEARIQARLVHQNICTLFDAFDEDGQLYLVQEYVEGSTVKHMLAEAGGPLPFERAIEIARGVLSGLAHAHEEGVVHRDIKPSNVMVDKKGKVKIMDFGIAKALGGERLGTTKAGMTVGTPEYMSPEQILGKDVDARSDIYSVGMMLFEMLTGGHPCPDPSSEFAIHEFHVRGIVPSVRKYNQSVPAWLDDIVTVALAKQSNDRFKDSAAFLAELDHHGTGIPHVEDAERRARIITVDPTVNEHHAPSEIFNLQCPQCGKDNPNTAQFCVNCGAKLLRKCPACRKAIATALQFCPCCGAAPAVCDQYAATIALCKTLIKAKQYREVVNQLSILPALKPKGRTQATLVKAVEQVRQQATTAVINLDTIIQHIHICALERPFADVYNDIGSHINAYTQIAPRDKELELATEQATARVFERMRKWATTRIAAATEQNDLTVLHALRIEVAPLLSNSKNLTDQVDQTEASIKMTLQADRDAGNINRARIAAATESIDTVHKSIDALLAQCATQSHAERATLQNELMAVVSKRRLLVVNEVANVARHKKQLWRLTDLWRRWNKILPGDQPVRDALAGVINASAQSALVSLLPKLEQYKSQNKFSTAVSELRLMLSPNARALFMAVSWNIVASDEAHRFVNLYDKLEKAEVIVINTMTRKLWLWLLALLILVSGTSATLISITNHRAQARIAAKLGLGSPRSTLPPISLATVCEPVASRTLNIDTQVYRVTTDSTTSTTAEAQQRAVPKTVSIDLGIGLMPEMVLIPTGTFVMGSLEKEGRSDDEMPLHQVTISKPFYMGKYEVTQAQWVRLMGSNPSNFKGDDLPVENVSWNDCVAFCRKLTEREQAAGRLKPDQQYRLPSEAEWEYACRAGTTTRFYTGDTESDLAQAGWYVGNSKSMTHPVGQNQPNAYGLYDMHGNVCEWCADWYGPYSSESVIDPVGQASGSFRVVRGGSWGSGAGDGRSADRGNYAPAYGWYAVGFRLSLPAGK